MLKQGNVPWGRGTWDKEHDLEEGLERRLRPPGVGAGQSSAGGGRGGGSLPAGAGSACPVGRCAQAGERVPPSNAAVLVPSLLLAQLLIFLTFLLLPRNSPIHPQALRPASYILMGKNTMMRKCIRDYCERIGDDSWMVMAGAYTRSH